MSAAAVAEAELADIDLACLVDDRFADHDRGVLLLEAPRDVNADLNLRPHSIDHETVAGINGLERSQVQNSNLSVDLNVVLELLLEKFLPLN